MLNKKVILALVSGLLLQNTASASVGESIQKAAFECVNFTCPAIVMRITGLDYILENIARNKEAKKIVAATDDALFFKAHVMETKKGEMTTDLYSKMVIHVAPGDVLTQSIQVKNSSSDGSYFYSYEDGPLDVDTTQPIILDNTKVAGVKINGRPLVSKALGEAHLAVQFLIFSDAIVVSGTDRSSFSIATDALALNDIAIMFANKK